MANDCAPIAKAVVLQVNRLEDDGSPMVGEGNQYITNILTQMQLTPVYKTGDEVELPNANGDMCGYYKDRDRLKRDDVTMGLCRPDPELMELLAGGVVLTDGDAVGYGSPSIGEEDSNGVGIQLWAKRFLGTTGNLDPDFPYARFLYPRVYLTQGQRTHENAPLTIQLTGWATENPQWLDGPDNDWPVDSDRIWQWIPTTTVPDAVCGYVPAVAS